MPQSIFTGKRREIQSLAELIQLAVRQYPDSGIYFVSGAGRSDAEFRSYSKLYMEAKQMLGGLVGCAPQPYAHVALLLENAVDLIPATWSCILGGYVPCPMTPIRHDRSRFETHLAYIDTLLDHPLFVTTDEFIVDLPSSLNCININQLRTATQTEPHCQRSAGGAALLFLTSGSTGNSKAVVLTHATVLASLEGKAEIRALASTDVMFNWVSLDHVVALIEAHFLPLYLGATQLQASPGLIITDPLLFLRIIDSFRVTTSFTPNFLLGQISAALQADQSVDARKRPVSFDLSCVRHIISGGEANPVSTGTRFLDLLAPYGLSHGSLWPVWGMTETCAASVYSQEFPGHDTDQVFASVGFPIRGLEMRIGNDQGAAAQTGEVGELQVRGPTVFENYYNNAAATRVAFTSDNWFRTGDLARIDDGRLTLIGRSKDCIIVSGVNYFSQELESALEKLDGVERTFVAAFPTRPEGADTEQLVIAFTPTFPLEDESRLTHLVVSVRNTTVMLWGFRPGAILPLPRDAFPKTNLGKIQRSLMRRRFEAGEYSRELERIERVNRDRLGPYTRPDGAVERDVVGMLAQMFGLDPEALSATANFFDLGGTSLDILRLTRMLDQRFGFEATLTTVLQHQTAKELASVIARGTQIGAEYEPIVPLQLTGSQIPLFLVHPGDGGTLVFVNLAKYFVNERPLYALRARGFDPGEECFKSFGEVVSTYVQAILRRQPSGPYAIAGYSLGASIAFEVAKTLVAAGERVAFLGCIDGQPCGTERQADFAATLSGASALLNLIDARHFSSWSRVANSLHVLSRSHVISGTVQSMVIFASSGLPSSVGRDEWSRRLRAWNAFVEHPRYVGVSGDHNSLISPSHVASFQAVLHAELDIALNASGALTERTMIDM